MKTAECLFSNVFNVKFLQQPDFFCFRALESIDQREDVRCIFFCETDSFAELVEITDGNAAGFLELQHGEVGAGDGVIQ